MKIFREIRVRMLKENKLTRYLIYGIGEIILLVIGILIAVAINNWNINKTHQNREIKYLKNIKLDLRKDLASLKFNLEFRKRKYKGINKLIGQINGQPIEDVTELTINVFHSLMEERFTPNNSTYNELANSGNLNLITNDTIKILLLELEENYKTNNFGIEHETHDYREFISKPLFKFIKAKQLIPVYSGEKTIKQQHITKANFAKLFKSQEYENGLVITNLITLDLIGLYETMEIKSKKIIKLIEIQLEQFEK